MNPARANRSGRADLRVGATLNDRPVAIDVVKALLAHVAPPCLAFRHAMLTAFSEAFNRIARLGHGDESDGALHVEIETWPDALTFRLRHGGRPIDFARAEPPELDGIPHDALGLFLIHSTVDDVCYEPGSPNVLTLTKRVEGASLSASRKAS